MNNDESILEKEIKGDKNDSKNSKFKRGFKRNNKRGSHSGSRQNVEIRQKGNPINDPRWYAINDKIGAAVGSIPYNIFAGERIDLQTTLTDASRQSVPGVLALRYTNMPGRSANASSAVNIAAKALYAWVRHQNSGHSNYESSDLMIYILAMDSIYTAFFEAVRIYEAGMTYDYVNRNIPDVLASAMRVDSTSIRNNLAQFRAGLNIFAAKLSSMAVPATFNLFKRHALIARKVFMDSSSMRGQFYLWTQDRYHVFDPAYSAQGGGLRSNYTANSRTYIQVLQQLDSMLDPIISDEDMNIMSGDILKAFGREKLLTIPMVDEAQTLQFVEDEDMLAQIENSCAEGISGLTGTDIYQNNNTIIANPTLKFDNILGAHILNSHKDAPTWEDNLEFTRGMTFGGSFGTELIGGYHLYMHDYTGSTDNGIIDVAFDSFEDINRANLLVDSSYLTHFDWRPIMYLVSDANNDNTLDTYHGFIGDVKKFTLVSKADIARLHDSAVMGELNALLLEQYTTY